MRARHTRFNRITLGHIVLLLRNVLFVALIPGIVLGLVPYAIVSRGLASGRTTWAPAGTLEYAALLSLCLGASIMAWCIRDFAVVGRGTPAPMDPPTTLVRQGLYRHIREPMYLGALLVLLGETGFFHSTALLDYTAAWFIWVNVFVIFYEEPTLRRQFGGAYDEYCRSVGRWLPGTNER